MNSFLEKLEGSDLGFCYRDLNRNILFQNQRCKQNCGDQMGKICMGVEGLPCASIHENEIPDGMHTAKVPNTMSQDLDMMFLKSSGELVTFFQSKKDMAHYYLEQMKKYKLSDREEEILTYVLSGITRKEILVKLDIEMSTLKTHLNNLYKKLPAHWAQMLKARAY